jgi:general L-amino acid transport system permease protein
MSPRTRPAIAPRPAPTKITGHRVWLRSNLFTDWPTGLGTLFVVGVLLWCAPTLLGWALVNAEWRPDAAACRADGVGACWGVVVEKYRFIVFGRYPFEQQWRPLAATALVICLLVASGLRRCWHPRLLLAWLAVLAIAFVLMHGGAIGLPRVQTDRWGGLPLTVLLAALSIIVAFPLALALALGRRSPLPGIRSLCIAYIELLRGVPLISVLFMASFMFPLLMPEGFSIDVLLRVLAGITLFAAANMAEVIRGGLQAVPREQIEAAATLGLSYWQSQRKVVLPQALAMVVPGLVNNFIAIFKDTSLVTIVSLYELTGALSLALNSDAQWRPYKIEAYLFIALIYFCFCFSMSRYSLSVERQLKRPAIA